MTSDLARADTIFNFLGASEFDRGLGALGYRRYFGDWYAGPSLGFNVMRAVSLHPLPA